jgi:hypothetical protein
VFWDDDLGDDDFVYYESKKRELKANPTVMVIQHLGEKSIQTNRDSSDVLRHIIKNVSERLVRTI